MNLDLREHVCIEDGGYRYWLARHRYEWQPVNMGDRWCVFVMLNPSTADGERDDPTIRRCKTFAWRNDCNHLGVINLYAARATKPDALLNMGNLQGRNAEYIQPALKLAHLVIVGWGANVAKVQRERLCFSHPQHALQDLCAKLNKPVYCLGTTKTGEPRHPLYVPTSQELEPYIWRA